jgi:hypothetical protein
MAVPIFYLLIWSCIKVIISNKTVNTAIDHWTQGNSTKLDDKVWKLLELAAGIEDEELKTLALNTGIAEIDAQYAFAKEAGRSGEFKEATPPPIGREYMQALLALNSDGTGVC